MTTASKPLPTFRRRIRSHLRRARLTAAVLRCLRADNP